MKSSEKYEIESSSEKLEKVAKCGDKCGKVGKSVEKLEKAAKSWNKWGKV